MTMCWLLLSLAVSSATLCLGVEVSSPKVTPAKFTLPPLQSLLAKSPTANITSLSNVSLAGGVRKVPCTCGVFLTGQLMVGQQPQGFPPLLQEYDESMPCTPLGNRQCANKCLEVIARHLRNSATIICGSLDRDCFKERAMLWTKNCDDVWQNSHMSAGREFCCKDGVPYKCPLGKN